MGRAGRGKGGQILWKQRHKMLKQSLEEAWVASRNIPEDPGLRFAYDQIPRLPIRLIVCPLELDVNQGGLLRLADAFRLERVDMAPTDGHDFSGHRGTIGWQPHRWVDAVRAVQDAKADGYHVAALTLNDQAVPISRASWQFPLAIVAGRERQGVPPEVESLCDSSIAIPLFGLVTSLNVSVATGIAVHAAVTALAEQSDWSPVRATSRRLLGLEPLDFSEYESLREDHSASSEADL